VGLDAGIGACRQTINPNIWRCMQNSCATKVIYLGALDVEFRVCRHRQDCRRFHHADGCGLQRHRQARSRELLHAPPLKMGIFPSKPRLPNSGISFAPSTPTLGLRAIANNIYTSRQCQNLLACLNAEVAAVRAGTRHEAGRQPSPNLLLTTLALSPTSAAIRWRLCTSHALLHP
jgi:hypothetical protein